MWVVNVFFLQQYHISAMYHLTLNYSLGHLKWVGYRSPENEVQIMKGMEVRDKIA